MAEDLELCTRFKCHKQKLVFFLAAMRNHCNLLRANGFTVDYVSLESENDEEINNLSYESKLKKWIFSNKITILCHFEIADSFFKNRIALICKELSIEEKIIPSPMFLQDSTELTSWMNKQKRPFMKSFYESSRLKSGILIEQTGSKLTPVGGQFSFDSENRLPLTKGKSPPPIQIQTSNDITHKVIKLVENLFPIHPGNTENFWLPVTREESLQWLKKFFTDRFAEFGPYEDALSDASPWLYHSVLSPLLNAGLLTPHEVITNALEFAQKNNIPLNSIEGFVRQILGWREFIRGIYLAFENKQTQQNFFQHSRKLSPCWWNGTTGLLHLDRSIKKALRLGYCHHIERLMVIGNVMLLCEVHPFEAYSWFMQMFVDSADWVMAPNVYGMALFSDGGIFATKPYICASNYWLKMSGEKKEPWCDDLDSLYWNFVNTQRDFLLKNPRMSMMVRTFDKIPAERKSFLLSRAKDVKARLTSQAYC